MSDWKRTERRVAAKLSRLQKAILVAAYRNAPERDGKNGRDSMHLSTHEALHTIMGWPPPKSRGWLGKERYSIEEVGAERWRTDRASLSRAIRRLEARGLVECYVAEMGGARQWSGFVLTDAGRAAAAQLAETVNSAAVGDAVNCFENAC